MLNRFLFGLNIDFRLLGAQNDVVSISSVSSLDALLWLSWNSCNLRSKLADRSCSCFIAFCNLRSSFCDCRFALSRCRTCKQIKKKKNEYWIVNPLIAKETRYIVFVIWLFYDPGSCVPRTVATLSHLCNTLSFIKCSKTMKNLTVVKWMIFFFHLHFKKFREKDISTFFFNMTHKIEGQL